MGESYLKKTLLKDVLHDTFPVLTGYVVLGAGFGIIMTSNGYGILFSVLMSVFIFAGSMQYAAIGLFAGPASFLTVALTTAAVNARHIFYGISMIDKYKNAGFKKPYMIFALTDETYSLVSSRDKGSDYYFLVSLFNQIYWVTGTVIGAALGDALNFNTKGIDFALTALFITIFVSQWLESKNHFPAVSGVVSAAVCLLIFGRQSFLLPSMAVILVALLISMKNEEKSEKTREGKADE